MKIYLLKDSDKKEYLKNLIRLNTECAHLRWNNRKKDIPMSVMNSLDIIEEYIDNEVVANSDKCVIEFTEEEENELLEAIGENGDIKQLVGECWIDSGKQCQQLVSELINYRNLSRITDALVIDYNYLFF